MEAYNLGGYKVTLPQLKEDVENKRRILKVGIIHKTQIKCDRKLPTQLTIRR